MAEPTQSSKQRDFLQGVVVGLVYAVAYVIAAGGLGILISQIPIASALAPIVFGSLMLIGIAQFLYIAPLAVCARKEGRPNEAKGLLAAAGVVALLNATCWWRF